MTMKAFASTGKFYRELNWFKKKKKKDVSEETFDHLNTLIQNVCL